MASNDKIQTRHTSVPFMGRPERINELRFWVNAKISKRYNRLYNPGKYIPQKASNQPNDYWVVPNPNYWVGPLKLWPLVQVPRTDAELNDLYDRDYDWSPDGDE